MANENKDLLRVEATSATLSANVRNKQVGFETDGTFRQLHKRAAGQANYWTADGYVFATGIQYTHPNYPTVGNVKDGLDQAFAGITGISSGGLGFTGLSTNYLPRIAADGKAINSNLSEVPKDILYQGESLTITRTDNGAYPAYLILKHVKASPGLDDTVARLQMIGKNSSGTDQVYGQIDTQIDCKTASGEFGHVNIATASGGATVNKFRVGTQNGVQAYNSPFYNVDTALAWTVDQCTAFGCETGVQNTAADAREGGACSKIESINTNGGVRIEGFTKENSGLAVEIIAKNEGHSGGVGCVKIGAAMRDGTGLTRIATDSPILAVYNNADKVFSVNGNGLLITNSITSSETLTGVTGAFSGGAYTPGMLGCTGINIHGKTLTFDTGSFYASLTGCTGSFGAGETGLCKYTRVGNAVSIYIPQLAGFANVNTATIKGLPASLQTAVHSQGNPEVSMQCYQLSAGVKQGTIVIANSGTMALHSNNTQAADNWETTGGRTIYSQYVNYILD